MLFCISVKNGKRALLPVLQKFHEFSQNFHTKLELDRPKQNVIIKNHYCVPIPIHPLSIKIQSETLSVLSLSFNLKFNVKFMWKYFFVCINVHDINLQK